MAMEESRPVNNSQRAPRECRLCDLACMPARHLHMPHTACRYSRRGRRGCCLELAKPGEPGQGEHNAQPHCSSPDWQGGKGVSPLVRSGQMGTRHLHGRHCKLSQDTATHPTRRLSPPMPSTCFDSLSLSLFERERVLGETRGPFIFADPPFEHSPSPAFVCQLGFSNAPPPATISDGPDPSDQFAGSQQPRYFAWSVPVMPPGTGTALRQHCD